MEQNKEKDTLVMNQTQFISINSQNWNELMRLAKSPDTDSEVLDELAKYDNHWIRCCVATHSNTLEKTLGKLATDPNAAVRLRAICNPRTPIMQVPNLTKDPSWNVREALIKRTDILPDILDEMAEDELDWIKMLVAQKHRTYPKTLKRLAQSKKWEIRDAAKTKPNWEE